MAADITEADFEREVIEASHTVPVVVDFWADWCGPCKQLAPVLEAAVASRGGAVKLVKVDTEANQQLAAAMRIQSIPAVYAFKDGKPVDSFVGVLPPPQIEAFLDKLVPSATDEAVAAGDPDALRAVLAEDPTNVDAAMAFARLLLAAGQTADAIAVLEPVKDAPQAAGLITCAEIVLDPTLDPELAAALQRLAADPEGALEAMLAVLPGADEARRDRVRRVMIGVFAERAVDDPIVLEYRKRLARALN
ncbi:MAG: thioredoxin [Gaiellales bacterium]